MEGWQGLQASGTEACIPCWERGWELGSGVGNTSPSLNWPPHPPIPSLLTYIDGPCPQRLLKIPQAPSIEKDMCVG